MRSKAAAGALAGLIGGMLCGLVMNLVRTPEGESIVGLIGGIVGAPGAIGGWVVILVSSAAAGVLFGSVLGPRIHSPVNGMLWGAVYGALWWFVGGLLILPVLLGWGVLGPVLREDQTLALGQIAGHVVYGLSLGWAFAVLYHAAPAPRRRDETRFRPAPHH